MNSEGILLSTYENGLRLDGHVYRRQRRSIERLLLHLGIVLASLSMASVAPVVLGDESLLGGWLWISPAILFVACTGTAFRMLRADVQMVASPVFWVLLASGVYWGFGPLIYTFGDLKTIAIMETGYSVSASELFRTNMLNSVGMLSLVVGLAVGRRLVGRRPLGWVRRFEGLDALRVAGVLAAVGLTVKFSVVLPYVFGLIGTQSFTLLNVAVLSPAALMILSYLSVTRGGKTTAWFLLLFVIEILASSIMGGKTFILESIIAALIGRTLGVGKLSTAVKGVMVLGLMLFVLQPVITSYRMMAGRSTRQDYATSVANAGMLMAQSLSDLMNGTGADKNAIPQAWWMRLCYTPQQAFAMRDYDSGRPGSPWEDFAMGLIPRVLWRDKPLITPGLNFSALFDGNQYNNNAPGVLGEGYWYGGWLGLLVVGLYAGVFLGGVDRISREVISRRAWVFMPLVFIGVRNGFRIDGLFSTEFMFGSVWYVLFAVSIFYFSTFFLTRARAFPGHRRRRA